jgi:hypothetical protein
MRNQHKVLITIPGARIHPVKKRRNRNMKTGPMWLLKGCITIFVLALLLSGCGGGGGDGVSAGSLKPQTGVAKISLTDAPTTDLDHVWVTVKEIRFHLDQTCDDLTDGGWHSYPLPAPVTLDLAALNNGLWDTLWNDIVLPVGNYQQIRLILAGTEDPLAASATAKALSYNNQVTDGGIPYPLVIPAAKNGIKLIGAFKVAAAAPLHIVVDFDITHDVVETGNGRYILKPRLKYFVISAPLTAAITGTIKRPDGTPFANYTGVSVIIKAEAPETITFANTSTARVMGIIRATSVKPDGSFALYPLPSEPGRTYDLVIRGNGIRTMLLKAVPAEPGTTKDSPSMFDVNLSLSSHYLVSAQVVNNDTSPYEPAFGASVGFYQTLPGSGEIPYLIRFRHVNPLYGTFGNFTLPNGDLLAGSFNPKAILQSFGAVRPMEGADSFSAFATAPFFYADGPKHYTPGTVFNRFLLTPIQYSAPPECDMDDDWENDASPNRGYYMTSGGLIVGHVLKKELEEGKYEFRTSNAGGGNIVSHAKNEKVKLDNKNSKPDKIKFKK